MAATADLADRAAYLPGSDALVCADLHLGKDETSAVEIPLGERERIPGRIATLLERFEPATLVLAGDVLHAFDAVPESAVEALDAIREAAAEAGAELVLVEGNHDAQLEAVAEEPIHRSHRLDDGTVVAHGDELPAAEPPADRYVIGHAHPAIVIEGQRRPCYLHGPAVDRDADVLVLPAFNELTRGTVVDGRRSAVDPPLVGDASRFRPAVRDPDADETLWFPRLASFGDML